jgi:rhamnosyl/mannosyltransferase
VKILHIGKYYPPFHGGMENFLEDLAQEQAACGHRVWILCHWDERGRPTQTIEICSGLKVTRTKISMVLAYAPIATGFFRSLCNILNFFSPDVIHVHMPNLSAFYLLFLKRLSKIVVHWHSDVVASDYDLKLRMLYPGYRIFEKKLLSRAETVIATSEAYLHTSKPLLKFKEKCRVVPLGISLTKMNRFEQKSTQSWGVQESRDFLLAVGRFAYYKGFEYLIKACARGYKGKVVIVGDGPLRKKLESLVHKLALKQRVAMPGVLPDNQLYQLLSKCIAFCLPSIERTEAFGLVLLEAMYYAKPLITTNVSGSGMNEVNAHNTTGLVVAPENARELAEAMNFMVHNQALARAMGSNGRKRLLDKFAISRIAEKIERIYES